MTGSRLIVLATGMSVSGVETWVWKLATRLSGRGDGAESLSQKDLSTTKCVGCRCITAIFGVKATAIEILVPMFTRFV